jgi:hypothetical protein
MEESCRIQFGLFRYLKQGFDLRESVRLGNTWEKITIEVPDIETIKNTPPYQRDITIKSTHMGPIETADSDRSRSKYFYQCIPDNELPFLECCAICTEQELCDSVATLEIQ